MTREFIAAYDAHNTAAEGGRKTHLWVDGEKGCHNAPDWTGNAQPIPDVAAWLAGDPLREAVCVRCANRALAMLGSDR